MSAVAASSSATAGPSSSTTPIFAQGDWTKSLVHLAKTAELKKHALTLQLHTAHILSAHATLDQKNQAMQDLKEQKNKLDSERARLLNCLREVNEDRDKTDMLEAKLNDEISDLQGKIKTISDGEYTSAKNDVDRLRQELGQPPLPSLQQTLEEKSQQYLKELRLAADSQSTSTGTKRSGEDGTEQPTSKRPRGRPKGSKNSNKKNSVSAASTQQQAPPPQPSKSPANASTVHTSVSHSQSQPQSQLQSQPHAHTMSTNANGMPMGGIPMNIPYGMTRDGQPMNTLGMGAR